MNNLVIIHKSTYKYIQKLTNMDANAEQKFLERFFQFIDSEGGFYKVGEDVGVKAQTFYAMQSRKSIPNSATLLKMVEKYNGLDLNILFRGKPSEKEAELQKEIEELREKAKNAGSVEIQFPDETSEKLYKAFQAGKLDDVYSYLDQHRQLERFGAIEVTDETADDIIKLGMKLEYKDLTQAEIDYKFRKSFSLPKEPVQGISEDEDEFEARKNEWREVVEDIKMNKIIEAKLMKPKLEQSKSKLTLPEIEQFADDGYIQYQKELEEDQKSAAEAREQYQKLTTKAFETKMNFNDEANKISFDFQFEPEADSVKRTVELLSDPQLFQKAFVGQDGKPDRLKFAQVIHYGLNRERELMEAMKQAKNAAIKSSLPDNAQGNGLVRQLPQQQELSDFDKQMKMSLAPYQKAGTR